MLRTVTASPWTDEDRALMIAWKQHQDSLCPGCGHPKETAWHHMSSDSFDHDGDFICWACTAANPENEQGGKETVKYPVVIDTRDYEQFPLTGSPEPSV